MIHKDHICAALRTDIEHMIGECWSTCFYELDGRIQDKIITDAILDAEKKAESYGQALLLTFTCLCEDGAVGINSDYYNDIFENFAEDR